MTAALEEHIGYFSDPFRLDRYRAAVAAVVRPGDTVVDVGCGSGVLGLMCLQAGASKVWGIDSSPMIEAAQQTFSRAGLADRYICIHDHSFRAELPARVDIAICDHVGYFGFDYGVIETMADARRRFLKPGGRLIPSRIRLRLALVSSPSCRKTADAWGNPPVPSELHWLRQLGVNSKHAVTLTQGELASEPAALGTIDLAADNPAFFSFSTNLQAGRATVVDGLAGWFECELAEGIWMSNVPDTEGAIKRPQAFLPFDKPLAMAAGERLDVTISARPEDHLIAWTVNAPTSGQRIRQSTWQGRLMGPGDLLRAQPDRVPRPTRAARARNIVLEYCDGVRTARQVEQEVLRDHPGLFPTAAEISRFVANTLARDAE